MKRSYLLGLLSGLLWVPPAAAQDTVLVAAQEGLQAFYPLIGAVYARMGLKPVFEVYPSERSLEQVNLGYCDAEIGRVSYSTERYPHTVLTHEPLIEVRVTAWKKRGAEIVLKRPEDLRNYTVGFVLGNKDVEEFLQSQNLSANGVETLEQLQRMLESGRLQVGLVPDVFLPKTLRVTCEPLALSAPVRNVYHVFNVRHRDWVDRWDRALRELKQSGRYWELLPASAGASGPAPTGRREKPSPEKSDPEKTP